MKDEQIDTSNALDVDYSITEKKCEKESLRENKHDANKNMEDNQMSLRDGKKFIEYEKAIEGRNFHYQNYNTWMNLYAIFNGALFVGLYSILKQENVFYSQIFGIYKNSSTDFSFIALIILLCGFVASICWLMSFYGYYSWLRSWTRIVQIKEKKVKISVYKKYFGEQLAKNKTDELKKDYFSTQKISRFFISSVVLAWLAIGWYFYCQNKTSLILIILIICSLLAIMVITKKPDCLFSLFLSNIDFMEKSYYPIVDKKEKEYGKEHIMH